MATERPHRGSDLIRKKNTVVGGIRKGEQRSRVQGGGCAPTDPNSAAKRRPQVPHSSGDNYYGPGDKKPSPYNSGKKR